MILWVVNQKSRSYEFEPKFVWNVVIVFGVNLKCLRMKNLVFGVWEDDS